MIIKQAEYDIEAMTDEEVIAWLEHEAKLALSNIDVIKNGKIIPFSIKITLEE